MLKFKKTSKFWEEKIGSIEYSDAKLFFISKPKRRKANKMQETKFDTVFGLIEKAGGEKIPKIRELNSSERGKVVFNLWAFVFALFYYLYHGMWRKAITYFFIGVVIIITLVVIGDAIGGDFEGVINFATNFVMPAIFGSRANIDLYKKIRLGNNKWI